MEAIRGSSVSYLYRDGGASTGIAVEELARIGVECMIRIGSCGALQPEMQMGDLVILNGAVRDEGTSRAYVDPIFRRFQTLMFYLPYEELL